MGSMLKDKARASWKKGLGMIGFKKLARLGPATGGAAIARPFAAATVKKLNTPRVADAARRCAPPHNMDHPPQR